MNLHIQEILTQALSFILLVVLLKKFAWKPILATLDERKDRIQQGFDEIETRQAALAKTQAEYEQRLERIEEEARVKLQEAANDGKKMAAELREKAREDANQILVKAKQDITLEAEKAQIELRNKLADMVMLVSEKVIKSEMNDARQKQLVNQFLLELSGSVKE